LGWFFAFKKNVTKLNLEKLKDPAIMEIFKADIGGKFAPLLVLKNEDIEIESFTDSFTKIITSSTTEALGKHRPKKKPWVTGEILELCDKRRELKSKKKEPGGQKRYSEMNKSKQS